ncbi:outer membrane protein assembly factor BamB family protein [Novipirellula artificiosorum]|uniref:Outer membrane biogenesis protein BamB n=1 Tax=Novipirellula artificiosorum TaxID=2528016 RepID=A0A5C6DMG0_9BACT|nr:PQQ-binding-like beta-propeller repeat protein [Novipirellula artificiosorum]TWU36106.1 outer membrane biogenesis protein BamB [Novipirellula artificiosorum]
MKSAYLSTVFVWAMASTVLAADWPQFLGPQRNSTSPETGLLRSWPDAGPEVLWAVEVGRGYGGPAISEGKAYLLDREDEVGDTLRCFDLNDGKELWSYAYDAPGSVMFPGSRSVPTVDAGYVYTCGHNGDVYCIDTNTHQPVWKANVWTDFAGKPPASGGGGGGFGASELGSFPIWAVTQNPLVYGDLLILASQAPDAGVVAYDKLSGDVKWKTPSLGYVGYVSPNLVKIDGQDHLVMVTPSTNPFQRSSPNENNRGKFIGLDPLTGKQLWEYGNWNCHISVAPAIDAGDNRVMVVGGYELGATMVKIEKQGNEYVANEVFTTEEFGDQTKPPVLHNGHFYAQYGTNNRRDGLVCMNMDGEIMWKTKRAPGFNKGSMILVDGLILATDGEKSLYLIEPDPKEFKPLSSAERLGAGGGDSSGIAGRIGGGTQNWAPLALSDGKLLIRDHAQMKCVKVVK